MAATLDESRLRHPAERPIFVLSAVINLALLVTAVALVASGADWLERYPRLAKRATELQTAAGAAILAPFALTLLRNRRRASIRANSVQLSREQLPEIYEDYARMCAALGMREPPALFVSDSEIDAPSAAYSTWNAHFIVLDTRFLEPNLDEVRAVYRFYLGRELGRIRLGHTRWLDEVLIAYVMRLPVLRNPLFHARTYSHDRYAAYLAPDSVRGLVVQASGRLMLKRIDLDDFLRQAREVHGWWPRLANLTRSSPAVAYRIQALYAAGLLGRDADARSSPATGGQGPSLAMSGTAPARS